MVKRLLPLLWVIAMQSYLTAQTNCHYVLKGTVTDAHNHLPMSNATVVLKELHRYAITDENGNFIIKDLCRASYSLEFSHIECKKHSEKVVIEGNTEGVFLLQHEGKLLQNVVVTSKRVVLDPTQTSSAIHSEDLDKTKGQTLGDILKTLPGVTTLNTGSNISKPVVQGLHSDRVLIFNNGVRQEGQQWGLDHAPEIDPFIADKISVVKGAAGVKYGVGAIGGVVLVEPRTLRDTLGMGGEVNTMAFSNGRQGVLSAMWEGKTRRGLSWRIQGTGKRGGTKHTPQYNLLNTGIAELNGSAMAGFSLKNVDFELFYSHFYSKIGILKESHIGNLTDLKNVIEHGYPLSVTSGNYPTFSYAIQRPAQRVNHDIFKLKIATPSGEIGRLNVTTFFQHNLRQEYDFHRPGGQTYLDFTKAQIAFQMPSAGMRADWEHRNVQNWHGGGGVEGLFQYNNTFAGGLIPDYTQYTTGFYWTERWRKYPTPWEVEGGMRYDIRRISVDSNRYGEVNRQYHYGNVSASVGAIYHLGSQGKLTFNIGSAWRSPNVNELFSNGVHHGTASFERGDPNLLAERALNTSLSFHYDHAAFEVEASVFQNTIRDFIYLQADAVPVLTIRGAFPAFSYRQTDAQLRGGDISVNVKIVDNFSWKIKGSTLFAQNIKTSDWLPLMPADRLETGFRIDNQQFKYLKNIFTEINFALVRHQTRVPALPDYAPPPAGYSLVNIAVGSDIILNKTKINITLKADNLLNRTYREYLDRFRYFTDALGRNVSIRMKFNF
jgi:iron complex outermembrane receptor protein